MSFKYSDLQSEGVFCRLLVAERKAGIVAGIQDRYPLYVHAIICTAD